VFDVRLRPGCEDEFLAAYELIRRQVAEDVPGHLVDQVCQAVDDRDTWVITSEWATLADFERWERSAEHRELVRPLSNTFAETRSRRYLVRRETPSTEPGAPAQTARVGAQVAKHARGAASIARGEPSSA
jgi:heme-degrading monooxygenase HmoA